PLLRSSCRGDRHRLAGLAPAVASVGVFRLVDGADGRVLCPAARWGPGLRVWCTAGLTGGGSGGLGALARRPRSGLHNAGTGRADTGASRKCIGLLPVPTAFDLSGTA